MIQYSFEFSQSINISPYNDFCDTFSYCEKGVWIFNTNPNLFHEDTCF